MSKLTAIKNFAEVRWIRKFKNANDLQKYQQKMLKKQLKFIKENSEYYKDIDVNDMNSIPIIDKKIMMNNFDKLNTVGAVTVSLLVTPKQDASSSSKSTPELHVLPHSLQRLQASRLLSFPQCSPAVSP